MKTVLIFLFIAVSNMALGAVGDKVTTQPFVVEEIRVQLYQGDAYYYFSPAGKDWLAQGCPSTPYAYIKESDAGAKAILSVALTSKSTKTAVKFIGNCGDINQNPGYINITNIVM
ncbi:hypothetical protein CWB72_19650 [Pseudoalteromonas phenolica]|uniref:hypothetical protein n=1 Tax=Pseudoalteromonas phenolica TaxID=161398 RepID=UPI00110A5833|nr:hypothetical protein [Pseudoalteromonas phenolica]TMN86519.1 hypothetical protein CWB72_19650 [Pseudoalteromonas phenolica]